MEETKSNIEKKKIKLKWKIKKPEKEDKKEDNPKEEQHTYTNIINPEDLSDKDLKNELLKIESELEGSEYSKGENLPDNLPNEIITKNQSGFKYNTLKDLDIGFKEINIPIVKITTDGYKRGVNHRPIRQPHVNKIKASFTGDIEKPKVVYSSLDECYHILQRQHLIEAVKQLINEGRIAPIDVIRCDLIIRKSTGQQLDESKPEDRSLCFEYSYRVTDSQERNCSADTIRMVLELADRYKRETGKTRGVLNYIHEHQYGYKILDKGYIGTLKSYGDRLRENNLMEVALKEKWVEAQIKAVLDNYKLRSGNMKDLKINLPEWAYNKLKKYDDKFWLELAHVDKDLVKKCIENIRVNALICKVAEQQSENKA